MCHYMSKSRELMHDDASLADVSHPDFVLIWLYRQLTVA